MRRFECALIKLIQGFGIILIILIFISGCRKLPEGGYIGTYYLSFKDPKDSVHNSMFTYNASIHDISDHYISINGSELNRDGKKITGTYCVVSSPGGGPFNINIDAKWKKTNGNYRISGSYTSDFNYYPSGDSLNPWTIVHGTGTFELVFDSDLK